MINQLFKTISIFFAFLFFFYSSIAQQVTTFAGSTLGYADGIGTAAQFKYPKGTTVDPDGNVYVADNFGHRIRKITPAGVVTTLAGSGTAGNVDATGTAASFNFPTGIVYAPSGDIYVTDVANHKIRKVTMAGVVTTVAGGANPLGGHVDGPGSIAQFSQPSGVAIDSKGNLFISDYWNNVIRKITPDAIVSTFAGTGVAGYADGAATVSQFHFPAGIACDANDNLYVAELYNNKIRKITPAGVVSTVAGSTKGYADGSGTAVQFGNPIGIACDNLGNIYVADNVNNRIRKINALGEVTTYAGSDDLQESSDGYGTAADFYNPTGICFDPHGYLYVADENNNRIRRITAATAAVPLSSQTITFRALIDKYVGDAAFTLTATASSGLGITYVSSNLLVATISGNTVTIIGAGSTTITASQPGNASYNTAADVSQTLTVHKKSQTITFGALTDKYVGDADFALTAAASSGLGITYTSSDLSVATITGNTVTIVGAGSATITASQSGNAGYNAAADVSQTLTVHKKSQTISFGALIDKYVGDADFTLTATASSGLGVSYSSSNLSVATISGNTVTIVGAGSTTITAVQPGNAEFEPATSVTQGLSVSIATAIMDPLSMETSVYPNPASDYMIVTIPKVQTTGQARIILSNSLGSVVSENRLEMGKESIKVNTTDLAKGTYTLTIETNEKLEVKKIIIQ